MLVVWPCSAASRSSGGPKRVVFFLQNNGFDPRLQRQIGPKTGDPETILKLHLKKSDWPHESHIILGQFN